MTSTTILTLLLVSSFIMGRFLRRFDTPHFVFSGMLYLILGLLIGPFVGFGILTEELLYKLEPMTDLMTGLAGFILGLRMRLLLKHHWVFLSGILTGLITFILTALALFFIAPFAVYFTDSQLNLQSLTFLGENFESFSSLAFLSEINRRQFWFALGVAATASSVSLLSLGMGSRFQKSRSEITQVLSIMAPAGQWVAITLLGLCLAFARADISADSLEISMVQWILATLLSGIICGALFSLFIGRQNDENRILLAALGAIIFAAGIGSLLNVSSLFICFLTGITISVFSSYAGILKNNLVRLEEPIFVLLLVIGGAYWHPEVNSRAWLLPLIYFIVRFLAMALFAERIYFKVSRKKLPRLGQGLLGQDLIAVAMALSFAKEFPGPLAQLVLTTILGSIFLNDIVANTLLKKVILDNEQAIEVNPIAIEEEPS